MRAKEKVNRGVESLRVGGQTWILLSLENVCRRKHYHHPAKGSKRHLFTWRMEQRYFIMVCLSGNRAGPRAGQRRRY